VGVLGNPVFQLTVVFAGSVFHTGPMGLGLLNAALGAGAVLAAPLVSGGLPGLRLSQTVRWGLMLYGVALIAFGLAPSYLFGLVALVAVGGCFLAVISSANTAVQLMVADHLRGRVMACRIMVTTLSFPVGGMLQGWLSDLIGPRATLCWAGAAMLLSTLVLIAWRGRTRLERLDDPRDESQPAPLPG
jgi:predicted MFS family arabinose efflux permease